MSAGSEKIVALRRVLAERFPAARQRTSRVLPTGVAAVDEALGGGLWSGTLTEFVSAVPSGGNQSTGSALLLSARRLRQRVAWVDAANAFDLEGFDDDALAHLVWIRCESLSECWRAADLMARDPNYAAVVVDVRGLPERPLLRTRDSIWTRLQRAAEYAETALLVLTSTSLVPNAANRLVFSASLADQALTTTTEILLTHVAVERQRQRRQAHGF